MNTIYYPKLFHTLWTNYEDWVRNMPHHHEMNEVEKTARRRLQERGVTIQDIADLVFFYRKNIILA